ncbi:hypothetical protein PCANC_22363 [Puccinia coronata f. sp. avenae]|uniref:Uncharacterized protein n=1 Tax=Puccinia coronata f. sp. avenae TaxID=200324 RepID=A0A2N5U1Y4_9BASI|nr:hypothetical protein PCANC_22363 [Puccinia coronata f. sp. avenae]
MPDRDRYELENASPSFVTFRCRFQGLQLQAAPKARQVESSMIARHLERYSQLFPHRPAAASSSGRVGRTRFILSTTAASIAQTVARQVCSMDTAGQSPPEN